MISDLEEHQLARAKRVKSTERDGSYHRAEKAVDDESHPRLDPAKLMGAPSPHDLLEKKKSENENWVRKSPDLWREIVRDLFQTEQYSSNRRPECDGDTGRACRA